MFRVSGKLSETIGTFWWSVPKIWRVEKCTTFWATLTPSSNDRILACCWERHPIQPQPMDRSNRWPTMSAANTQQRSRRQQISPLCCPWWAAVNAGMRQVRVVYFKRHQQNRKSRIATSPEQDRATATNNNNNSPIISYAPLTRQRHYKGAQTNSKHWQRGDVWDLVLGICEHTDRQTDRRTNTRLSQPHDTLLALKCTILLTIPYDTRCYLTCARKPTWVSIIYNTEPTTKKWKTEKLKSTKQICSETTVKSLGKSM